MVAEWLQLHIMFGLGEVNITMLMKLEKEEGCS